MKQSYGELILPKDSILYCSSCYTYNEIIEKKDKIQFLYYVFFHPNELNQSLYLYKLTLKKDISLFFDIEFIDIIYPKLKSVLKYIINNHEMNKILSINLKKNNFDGYIGCRFNVSNKLHITIFNDNNIFYIQDENYDKKMIYNDIYNNKYIQCFIEKKATLNINKRYEEHIEKYINDDNNYKNINFFLLIKKSIINYHYGEKKDLFNILIKK
jgi:hypothetical protein